MVGVLGVMSPISCDTSHFHTEKQSHELYAAAYNKPLTRAKLQCLASNETSFSRRNSILPAFYSLLRAIPLTFYPYLSEPSSAATPWSDASTLQTCQITPIPSLLPTACSLSSGETKEVANSSSSAYIPPSRMRISRPAAWRKSTWRDEQRRILLMNLSL